MINNLTLLLVNSSNFLTIDFIFCSLVLQIGNWKYTVFLSSVFHSCGGIIGSSFSTVPVFITEVTNLGG